MADTIQATFLAKVRDIASDGVRVSRSTAVNCGAQVWRRESYEQANSLIYAPQVCMAATVAKGFQYRDLPFRHWSIISQ